MKEKIHFKKNKDGRRSVNVMLADFSYYNRHTLNTLYTPLGIGLIAQYANQQFGDKIDVSLFKNIDKFLNSAIQNPPDVVGLSIYYWNTAQNQYVVNRLREMFGQDVIIILGGPSIDDDKEELHKYLTTVFPAADALIVNEGEIGFSNILRKFLGNRDTVFKDTIDGVAFLSGDTVVRGRSVGLSMDLSTMGSPYLSGLMDDFINSDYQPLVQTSRFCPYTCAFCEAGKSRGKLRGIPIEQVKEELEYVSKRYADRPHHTLYLTDDNFGILQRDVEIAEAVKKCKEKFNYPQHVFFYNDKRFTETSRSVVKVLGDMNETGMCLSLQTDNPSALKAINRRNVTDKEIDSALSWAIKHGITSSTEFIFGLPYDTKKDFVETLDRASKRGFDNVRTAHLFLMDGIELNRPRERKKFGLKTKYRPLGTNYGKHDGKFFAEYEEVVVAQDTFTYEDFLEIRGLNFMFFTVFSLNFQKWFFQLIRQSGISLSTFFSRFIKPNRSENWPKEYLSFVDDFMANVEGELYDSKEEVIAKSKEIFEANNNDVGEPSRINTNFGARLIYLESNWIKKVMLRHLKEIRGKSLTKEEQNLASSLLNLGEQERVDLKKVAKKNEPFAISFDVIRWKKNKFRQPLQDLKMPEKLLSFFTDETQVVTINSFKQRQASAVDKDFYYAAQDFIIPRDQLLYKMTYNEQS